MGVLAVQIFCLIVTAKGWSTGDVTAAHTVGVFAICLDELLRRAYTWKVKSATARRSEQPQAQSDLQLV